MICTGAINFLWLHEPGFSNRLQVKYCAHHNTQFPAELTHREREKVQSCIHCETDKIHCKITIMVSQCFDILKLEQTNVKCYEVAIICTWHA